MRIETTIMLEPVAKARARTIRARSGAVFSYTPEKTAHAQNLIKDRVLKLGKYFEQGVPIRLEVTFYRQRPKSLPKRLSMPISKPDIDNYFKLLTDSLEHFLYYSDAQITTALILKRFGLPPRIELIIEDDNGEAGSGEV